MTKLTSPDTLREILARRLADLITFTHESAKVSAANAGTNGIVSMDLLDNDLDQLANDVRVLQERAAELRAVLNLYE